MAGVPTVPAADPASATSTPASDNKAPNSADMSLSDPAPTTNGQRPNNSDQKKDRKPRRERLPLPDVIPDAPVKRYPEPSKTDMQAAIDAEDAKLQACFDRLNSARAFYDERQRIRDDGKPAYEAARKLFNELNEECRVLFEERKDIVAKLKDLKDAEIAARSASTPGSSDMVGAGKDGVEALKGLRTIEELEDRIRELEYGLETASYSILEEKKIVAQISFLNHKGREFITGRDKVYKDERAAKEQRIATRKELEEARKSQDARIDAAKAKLDKQKKAVDDVRAEQEAKIRKLQETTSEIDRDAERKKIGEIKAVIRKLRDDYQAELDKWYLNERIHIEQQRIAKRKKYEAAQAEREARRKAWEAEQAQYPEPDPYQEQKDMCSGLTVYLQTLLGETVDKPTVNLGPEKASVSLKATSTTREITAKGKAIGKSTTATDGGFENLAFSDFVKKSGGKTKGRRGRRSVAPSTDTPTEGADMPLKPHSIDYIAAFTELDIKPPNKISEVRAALEAVKAKKAYYDSKPKPTEEEKAKMAASRAKKQVTPVSEKKPKSNGMDVINGDGDAAAFPVLLGDSATPGTMPLPSRDLAGPSFKAVAIGTATAPPPTPTVSSSDTVSLSNVGAGAIMGENALGSVTAIVANEPVEEDNAIVSSQQAPLTEA